MKWVNGIKKPVGAGALPENNEIRNESMKQMPTKYVEAERMELGSGPAYESADFPYSANIDVYNTQFAIAAINEMAAKRDKPFFLGMRFKLPHLNSCAPKKYWDLYDPQMTPVATDVDAPLSGAAMGLHASFELRARAGVFWIGPLRGELS